MAPDRAAATLLETARALRPRILAERERIEAERRLPEEITREMVRAGFFRIFLPAAYGGLDLTPLRPRRSTRSWHGPTPPSRGA